MTYADIIFSQVGSLVVVLVTLVFAYMALVSFFASQHKKPFKYSNNRFFLTVVVFALGFLVLIDQDHAVIHTLVMPFFTVAVFLFPAYFAFSHWGIRYFSNPKESILYSSTFVIVFYTLTIWPSHAAEQDLQRIYESDGGLSKVVSTVCERCDYYSIGKLGDYVIVYDKKNEAVLAINDRNIDYIRHKLSPLIKKEPE